MIGDMKQEAGENSNAYQAKRDINITHQGMDYQSVKQLCLDLMHDNFPKLQEKAMTQVIENVEALASELKIEIAKKQSVIDPEKLAQPDAQASLNEAVQGAAKKGKKADLNLLASLVVSRIDRGNSGLLDITIEEAIRITPKLTSGHINFLSIKHFVSSMKFTITNPSFGHLEMLAASALAKFGENCALSLPNVSYLAGLGVLDFNPLVRDDVYGLQFKSYPSLAENEQEFRERVKVQAPSLSNLLELYEKESFPSISLNSFGQVIALSNLGRIFDTIDLKKWIN